MTDKKVIAPRTPWYNTGWIQAIITALILPPIVSPFNESTKNIPVLSYIVKFLSFIWLDVFNYKLPIYITIILIFIVIIGARNFLRYKELITNIAIPKVDYLNYRQDKIKRWTWTWRWLLRIRV